MITGYDVYAVANHYAGKEKAQELSNEIIKYAAQWEANLRDQFAMAALQSLDIQAHVKPPAAEHLAESAYHIADAMLKARE